MQRVYNRINRWIMEFEEVEFKAYLGAISGGTDLEKHTPMAWGQVRIFCN